MSKKIIPLAIAGMLGIVATGSALAADATTADITVFNNTANKMCVKPIGGRGVDACAPSYAVNSYDCNQLGGIEIPTKATRVFSLPIEHIKPAPFGPVVPLPGPQAKAGMLCVYTPYFYRPDGMGGLTLQTNASSADHKDGGEITWQASMQYNVRPVDAHKVPVASLNVIQSNPSYITGAGDNRMLGGYCSADGLNKNGTPFSPNGCTLSHKGMINVDPLKFSNGNPSKLAATFTLSGGTDLPPVGVKKITTTINTLNLTGSYNDTVYAWDMAKHKELACGSMQLSIALVKNAKDIEQCSKGTSCHIIQNMLQKDGDSSLVCVAVFPSWANTPSLAGKIINYWARDNHFLTYTQLQANSQDQDAIKVDMGHHQKKKWDYPTDQKNTYQCPVEPLTDSAHMCGEESPDPIGSPKYSGTDLDPTILLSNNQS